MASDATLAGWVRKADAEKVKEAAAAEAKKGYQAKILAELSSRGVDSLEVAGFKVIRKANRTDVYSISKLRERIGRKAVFLTLVKSTLDSKAVKAALKDGSLSPMDLAYAHTGTEVSAAYVQLEPLK